MAAGAEDVRGLLRSLPVFAVDLPEFDVDAVPADPVTLFVLWLTEAIKATVPEPHTMTVSTADDRGRPSSRVLICKNVDEEALIGRQSEPLADPADLDSAFGALHRSMRDLKAAAPDDPPAEVLGLGPAGHPVRLVVRVSSGCQGGIYPGRGGGGRGS
jgi:hypothetical protein